MAGYACVDRYGTTIRNCDYKDIVLNIEKNKELIIKVIEDVFPKNKIVLKTINGIVNIKIGNDLTLTISNTYKTRRNYLKRLLRRLKTIYELKKIKCDKDKKDKKCYAINMTIKHLSEIRKKRSLPKEYDETVYLKTEKELIGKIVFDLRKSGIEHLFVGNAGNDSFYLGSEISIITDKYTNPHNMKKVMIFNTTKSVTVNGLTIKVKDADGSITTYRVNKGKDFPEIINIY